MKRVLLLGVVLFGCSLLVYPSKYQVSPLSAPRITLDSPTGVGKPRDCFQLNPQRNLINIGPCRAVEVKPESGCFSKEVLCGPGQVKVWYVDGECPFRCEKQEFAPPPCSNRWPADDM